MRKLWAITLNDLRAIFANPGIWINLVLIPIGLVFVIGFANGGFNSGASDGPQIARYRLDVIDHDDGELSAALVAALRDAPSLLVCVAGDENNENCRLNGEVLTEARAVERVQGEVSQALVIVPDGFSAAARDGEEATVIYRARTEINTTTPALAAVQNAVERVGGALVAAEVALFVADDLGAVRFAGYEDEPYAVLTFTSDADREAFRERVYERAATLWASSPGRVDFAFADASGAADPGNQPLIGFRQSVPGMGSMYVMFTVLAGMTALLQERKQWTLQRLVVMPVARWQILGGKMLARFLMGMIQYAVVFSVGAFIGLRYESVAGLLLLMLAFVAVVTALTFLLATVVQSENQASSLSLFLALTLAPLGGAWWPLEIVPGWMQQLALVNPVGWAMRGFTDLLIYERGFETALLPAAVLYAAAAVLFFVAVRRFRYV